MIKYYTNGFEFADENCRLAQFHDPATGLPFEGYEEVAQYVVDNVYPSYPNVIDESFDWFNQNEIECPKAILTYKLDDLKSLKYQEINDSKQKAQDIGVLYKGYHYQMDADGKANILGIRIAIQDGSYTQFPIAFKTYENKYVQLSKDEYIEMSNAALNFVYKCLEQKETLCAKVNAATSVEELDAIKWEFE